MRRTIRVVAVALALALLPLTPAQACSCAWSDPRETLSKADGAFIGEFVFSREATTPTPGGGISSGREVIYTFNVDEDFKVDLGDTVEIHSAADGAACGLEATPGSTYGLFIYLNDEQEWTSGLCSQIDPDELRAAAAPLPEPDGVNPVRFLAGGAFGEGRMVALDEAGRTLAYGYGEDTTGWIDVCPGSQKNVEIVYEYKERARLVVRRLSDFVVERTVTLPFDNWYEGRRPNPDAVRCANEDASKVYVLGTTRAEPKSRSRLIEVTPDGISTVHYGNAFGGIITARRAFLATGRYARNITKVNLRNGHSKRIAGLKPFVSGLALSPDGKRLTAISARYGKPSYLHVITLATSRMKSLRVSGPDRVFAGKVVWQSPWRFVVLPSGGDNYHAVTYNRRLKQLGRMRWDAYGGAVHNATAYGITWSGELIEAPLPDGPASVIATLVSRTLGALTVVPGNTSVEPATGEPEGSEP